jgi:lipopolysaccharide transport system ATP-binding protein
MEPVISIKSLGKKYKLGLVHDDLLINKLINSGKRLFRKGFEKSKVIRGADEIWALKNINFDIMQGDVVGIIGRNGAGKSTLLKILSRITDPTEGEIRLKGRVASLLEVGTGFHPELTGRENVYLNGAILGLRRYEISKKFDEIVSFSEVERFIDTPVKRYSSGMYVRLAFAVAAHLEPEILVVDEVLAVGDVMFQKKCLGKMESVSSEGRTVLFVSHNMGTIGKLCKTAFQLEDGYLINSGQTDKVIENYLSKLNHSIDSESQLQENTAKSMSFKKIRLQDHNGEISTVLDRVKPFRIEIVFRVRETIKNAYVLFVLSTIDDINRLCISRDIDEISAEHNSGILEPGLYSSTVEFPGNILNVGAYYARLGLFKAKSLMGKEVVDQAKSPSFELIDVSEGSFQTSLPQQKRGILAMDLKWCRKRLD